MAQCGDTRHGQGRASEDRQMQVDTRRPQVWEHGLSSGHGFQDMVLKDDDHATWPARLTSLAGKTLVITGRDATRTFNLRDLLVRLGSFVETALSRRRDLASLIIISISLDEVMTDSELRDDDTRSTSDCQSTRILTS